MKAVQLLVNSFLPPELRDYGMTMDSRGLEKAMVGVARGHPDKFGEITKQLADIGRMASWSRGTSIRLGDLKPVIDMPAYYKEMDRELDQARFTAVDDDDWQESRQRIWLKWQKKIEKDTMSAGTKQRNSLVTSVASGARGKPAQVAAMIGSPGIYQDSQGRIVPLFVRNSFAQGLRPAELLATTFGARSAVVGGKQATAKGGDLCLAQGTLVRMADYSTKAIEKIRKGDWVLGSDIAGNTFPVCVVNTFKQGVKHVFDYNLSKFATVSCTENHKFLVRKNRDGKVRAMLQPIGKASGICYNFYTPVSFCDAHLRQEPLALLTGLLLGDGSMPVNKPKSRVCFTCCDPSLIQDTSYYLNCLGLSWVQRATQPHQYRVSRLEGVRKGIQRSLRSDLFEMGMAGMKALTKTIPASAKDWDNESIANLIRGYFATDGCVTFKDSAYGGGRHYFSFGSISKELLEGIRDLCAWRFGVRGSVVNKAQKEQDVVMFGKLCHVRQGYLWMVSSEKEVKIMEDILISAPGVKAAKLREILRAPKRCKRPQQAMPRLQKKTSGSRDIACFDIEVGHPDHLFVLGCGLICSNSKQVASAVADLGVTQKDCGTKNGIDLDIDDDSLRGRVTTDGRVIDKHQLSDLRNSGLKKVMVRSAMTCEALEGLCAKCLGLQANGKFQAIGSQAGITGGHALFEPVIQGLGLNQKHLSGMAGGKKEYSGLDTIVQFVQAPEEFPDAAAVSRENGLVESVRDAPQGGKIVTVEGREHYALPGTDIMVKPGDQVERGDQLSGGLMNPSDVVETRGLGEGRRYYADRLKQILDDSGVPADRRNTELLARGALRHVRIDDADEDESWLPEDLVDYNRVRADWKMPGDVREMPVDEAYGKWLAKPVLHHTIGTQLTPRMGGQLKDIGATNVTVTGTQPKFHAEMPRLRTASHVQEDWLASQSTSYLKEQLLSGAERGADSNVQSNLHYAPRLAIGEGFGQNTAATGKF